MIFYKKVYKKLSFSFVFDSFVLKLYNFFMDLQLCERVTRFSLYTDFVVVGTRKLTIELKVGGSREET